MTTPRFTTLRMLSPLFATALGVLQSAGCVLPKQQNDDEKACDDGNVCE